MSCLLLFPRRNVSEEEEENDDLSKSHPSFKKAVRSSFFLVGRNVVK
jgi:hypothetical protein